MAAYTSLQLVANSRVKGLTKDLAESLLFKHEIIKPSKPSKYGRLGFALADDLVEIFQMEEAARQENSQFFSPYEISFDEEVEIMHADYYDPYEATGGCFSIHGYGYFWPWGPKELRMSVTRHEKLTSFRAELMKLYKGDFVYPEEFRDMLEACWVDCDDGWIWFGCETY